MLTANGRIRLTTVALFSCPFPPPPEQLLSPFLEAAVLGSSSSRKPSGTSVGLVAFHGPSPLSLFCWCGSLGLRMLACVPVSHSEWPHGFLGAGVEAELAGTGRGAGSSQQPRPEILRRVWPGVTWGIPTASPAHRMVAGPPPGVQGSGMNQTPASGLFFPFLF